MLLYCLFKVERNIQSDNELTMMDDLYFLLMIVQARKCFSEIIWHFWTNSSFKLDHIDSCVVYQMHMKIHKQKLWKPNIQDN